MRGTWVFLLTTEHETRRSTVDCDDDPLLALERARSAGKQWQLELVIGPLGAADAARCALEWREQSRGVRSRRAKGFEIALARRKAGEHALQVFDRRVVQR
jgi:hypothetical protein